MNYAKLEWREGQPYSPEFDDVYFSVSNGIEETEHVFIHHNQLRSRFKGANKKHFVIAETGFGSGLNFLTTVNHWLALSQVHQCLHFYSIENTPFTLSDLILAQHSWPELQHIAKPLQAVYQVASYGFHSFDLLDGRVKLVLMIGDVHTMLSQLTAPIDAWFLDGFAPNCNPDMWSDNVFLQIQRLSRIDTTFSTYTAAGFVRRGLMSVGFEVKKVSGTGKKRHMLVGRVNGAQNSVQASKVKNSQPWYEGEGLQQAKWVKKITVIGAGIVGLTSAWALIKRGYSVEIIDAGSQIGAQASGNPQAMIMPRLSLQDSADAEFYTSAYFYALRSLQQLDPHQTCWKQTGGMQLAHSERIKKQMANYPQTSSLAEVLDAQCASELSGVKIDAPVHYFSKAACVYPHEIMHCMVREMGDALTITLDTSVESIDYKHDQWHLYRSSGELIHKTTCLVLANAWQVKRFKVLKHIHCQPARGQLSYYNVNRQSTKLKMPLSFDGYLMPEYKNLHVSGASFELDDCDTSLRKNEFQANFQYLNQWVKGLFTEQSQSSGRASVRAVTSDRVPVVGVVNCHLQMQNDYTDLYKGKPAHKYPLAKTLPGLFVNTGHGARGFTSAFLSSEIIAAMICSEPLPVSNRVRYALHSSRFLIRSLKKKR